MKTSYWLKIMQAARLVLAGGVLLGGISGHAKSPEPLAMPPTGEVLLPTGAAPKPGVPVAEIVTKSGISDVPAGQVGPAWITLGPAPTIGGQVTVPPNNEIGGCIQALAIHPTNPDIMYIAAVNGSVWRT